MMHHGTLMFSSDVKDISGALTPNAKKFKSKGVKSVQSRVTNISSHLPGGSQHAMDTAEFLRRLYGFYQQRFPDAVSYELSPEDQAAIRKLADEKYSTWEWNYGASPAFAVSASRKYDFGLVDVRLNVVHGRIKDIRIFGDYFGIRSISEIEELLTGIEYRQEAIADSFSCVALEDYISGMTTEKLTQLIVTGV